MTILATVDETERSKAIVPIAHELAEKYDESLVVLHVIPEENYEAHKTALESVPEFSDFSITQEQDTAKRYARRIFKETVGETDVDVEPRGRVGDVADETLAECDRVDPRFLVISGRRRSPTGKAIFGDVTQRILLNADCPVVTKMGD